LEKLRGDPVRPSVVAEPETCLTESLPALREDLNFAQGAAIYDRQQNVVEVAECENLAGN